MAQWPAPSDPRGGRGGGGEPASGGEAARWGAGLKSVNIKVVPLDSNN